MSVPIALQLYTVRDAIEQDFAGTVEKVAALGYPGVETAFFPEHVTVDQAAKVIKDLGLVVPAAHCEIPLGDQEKPVLEMMAAYECQRIVWHGWPRDEDYGSVDGIKRLADRYNRAKEVAVANGMSFGIHNHWWEYEPLEGKYPYQILLEHMDPAIFFEVDTYWVKTAGLDPVAVVRELGSRAPLLHIKDGPATQEGDMTAVGSGTMNIPAVIGAGREHTEWLIVELDRCATDMMEAVANSYAYLTGSDLGYGNK